MKNILLVLFTLASFSFVNQVCAQQFSALDKSPMDVSSFPSSHRMSDKLVKVIYSRPQLKGRKLSKLLPEGKVWRTGANEAAEIVFYKDVLFGGKQVKAGRYTLFTIPNKDQWTVILSTAKNVWGAYFYRQEEDVVRVVGTVSQGKKSVEAFSVAFDGDEKDLKLFLGWGKTLVSVPVLFQ